MAPIDKRLFANEGGIVGEDLQLLEVRNYSEDVVSTQEVQMVRQSHGVHCTEAGSRQCNCHGRPISDTRPNGQR